MQGFKDDDCGKFEQAVDEEGFAQAGCCFEVLGEIRGIEDGEADGGVSQVCDVGVH